MKLLHLKLPGILLLLVSMSVNLYAQRNCRLSGCLKNAQTHEIISFATVVLTMQGSNRILTGTQTDSTGNFVIDNLPEGIFTLRLSFAGYETITKEHISLNPLTSALNLGDIQMSIAISRVLNEVTVTARKPTLQNSNGKKVFAVNQSLVSEGGTAADLLQNVPTLQIGIDGNVSLRGSDGVKVLVDGKASLIAGGDVIQILQSIPASAIETIEVIANPSAKYEAGGQSIVNIVLKKNNKPGTNGSIALTGGTRDNYNISSNVSYQDKTFNLYGNYSIRNGITFSNGVQYLTYLNPTDPIVYSNEYFPSNTSNKVQNAKAGIDYFLSPKKTLSLSGSFNSRVTHRDEVLFIDYLTAAQIPEQSANRINTTNNNGNSYELSLDYSQHFKRPKEELTFNFSYAHGRNNNLQNYQPLTGYQTGQTSQKDPSALQNDIRTNTTNYNLQADYALPIGQTGLFAAGYRSQISPGDNDQYAYNLDSGGKITSPAYIFTGFFNSNNQIHAIWLNYTGQIKQFSYQAGLRAEDALLNATLDSYDSNNVLYRTPISVASKGLYPSIFLTQKLKGNQQLQFSYTRRVTRPTPRELNPSIDFSDPTNYERGNPDLVPQHISSVELGYTKNWHNISLISSLYYTQLTDVIKHIESAPVNGVIITTSQNLKRSTSTGLELISHINVIKSWDFTANLNIFQRNNDAAPQFGILANNGLSWNANITNNITLIKDLSVQIRTDYRAADFVMQDRNRPAFGLDAGARYDFPRKKASLSFSSRDIFNSRKWAFLRTSDDLLMNFERRTLGSRASLTFTYRFGRSTNNSGKPKKTEEKPDRRIDDAS